MIASSAEIRLFSLLRSPCDWLFAFFIEIQPNLTTIHPMKVIITGGAGFLGKRLAHKILQLGALTDARGNQRQVTELILFDIIEAQGFNDTRVKTVAGDLGDANLLAATLANADSVFHLAAIVSGEAEQDFDKGMRVNLDGTRALLEQCRKLAQPPKVVFTSSCAVFGGPLPALIPDHQELYPQTSYGVQKAMCELLISDMSRKGFIDGRSLRLPTITVRPGKPNRALSGYCSGIIREPLNGINAICPVEPSTRAWLLSPRKVIDNLIIGHDAPASAFKHTRAITVPGIAASAQEQLDALRRVAGDEVANRVTVKIDPLVTYFMNSLPIEFEANFGRALGMTADTNFDEIVKAHIEDSSQ